MFLVASHLLRVLEAKALTLVGKQSVSIEGKGPSLSLTDEAVMSSKTLTLKGSEGLLRLDGGGYR